MNEQLRFMVQDLSSLRRLTLFEYTRTLETVMPELAEMSDCRQDPVWHAEGDVLTHTQMVMDAALDEIEKGGLSRSASHAVYLAAFLHDVGKPLTTMESIDGRIISTGHSKAGLSIARSILHRLGTPYELRDQTLMLILHHMTGYRMVRRLQPDFTVNGINVEMKKYRQLSTDTDLRALYHLTRADWLGRYGTEIERVLDQMEFFCERSIHYGVWNRRFEGLLGEEDLKTIASSEKERARIKHEMLLPCLEGRVQTREEAIEYIKSRPEMTRPTDAHLYITVGVPGIGKSTWLAANLKDVRVVSSDSKREELFNDVNWQGDNTLVFAACYSDIENALVKGERVVLDATNIKPSQRGEFLNMARHHHAHTTIIYFDFPLEVAFERNAGRDRRVPRSVIANYFDNLVPPRWTEAQELIVVSPPPDPAWQ
jgi:putative nucleotidyltransferase with HDIG domain